MVKFLRENRVASLLLVFARVWLGWTWLTAGWGKLTGDGFSAAGFLTGAVNNEATQGWWSSFLSSFALPNVELFSFLVAWGQLLIGVALIVGLFTTFAALMGVVMNFSFILSGSISTNPNMIIIAMFILVAGLNAGKLGLDRWVIPYLRYEIKDLLKRTKKAENIA